MSVANSKRFAAPDRRFRTRNENAAREMLAGGATRKIVSRNEITAVSRVSRNSSPALIITRKDARGVPATTCSNGEKRTNNINRFYKLA